MSEVDTRGTAPAIGYREMEESVDLSHIGHPDGELMTINFGPHHPATHGVLRLLVTLEQEIVREMKPIIGYVHTGIEKNCEEKPYWKVIPYVERMDYVSYFFQMQAFCGAAALKEISLLDSVTANTSPTACAGAVPGGAMVVSRTSSLVSSRVTAPAVAATPVDRLIWYEVGTLLTTRTA